MEDLTFKINRNRVNMEIAKETYTREEVSGIFSAKKVVSINTDSFFNFNRVQELQTTKRDLRVNKKRNINISPTEKIYILQYKSSGPSLNFNDYVTADGFSCTDLIYCIKSLLAIFNLSVYKDYDKRYCCRHLSVAVIKGYLKQEDLENVRTTEDYLQIIASLKDIDEIKQDLAENETVLDKLQRDFANFMKIICVHIRDLTPSLSFDIDEKCNLYIKIFEEIYKLKEYLFGINTSEYKNQDFIFKDQEIYKQSHVLTKSLTSQLLEIAKKINVVKLTKEEYQELYKPIENNLQVLEKLLSETLTENKCATLEILASINICLNNIKNLPQTAKSEAIHKDNEDKLKSLHRIANYLKSLGYNKDYEIIESIIAGTYILRSDLSKLSIMRRKHYASYNYFFMSEQGQKINDSFYTYDDKEQNIILCSEASFIQALFHLCKADSNFSVPNERGLLFITKNHVMELTIKSHGNKRHLIFYDPNDTTTFYEIEVSTADKINELTLEDFLSIRRRLLYNTTSFLYILSGYNNEFNIFLIENKK